MKHYGFRYFEEERAARIIERRERITLGVVVLWLIAVFCWAAGVWQS